MRKLLTASVLALATGGVLAASAPAAAQYRQEISNDMRPCAANAGPAIKVTVQGVRGGTGVIRLQSYRAIRSEWMEKGRWLHRIEVPARAGTMTFCVPVPSAGSYGIAVRHDVNGNGRTDLRTDGGAMSNNPSINVFNLGRPSWRATAFAVGEDVRRITIRMRYM